MQLATALFHPEKYQELAKKKWWQTALYFIFWVFFVTIVVNITNLYLNGIDKEEIRENIPEFTIQDGLLKIDGDVYEYTDEEGSIYIKADTSISDFPKDEEVGEASEEFHITKDKIVIYLMGEKYATMSIPALGMDELTKEGLADCIYVSVLIASVIMILLEGGLFLVQTLLYILMTVFIGDIIAKSMGKRIAFEKLFKCGIYASTLGILCQLLQLWHILRGVAYEPTIFYYLSHIITIVYMVRVVMRWERE